MIQRSITICLNDVGSNYKALICYCRHTVEDVHGDLELALSMLKQTCLSVILIYHVFFMGAEFGSRSVQNIGLF